MSSFFSASASTSAHKAPLHPLDPTASPAADATAFVAVLTPTDHVTTPATEDVDGNGIRVGAWASPLEACDPRVPYFWAVCCCPCVPVAQLEVRLGLSSYTRALLRQGLGYMLFLACFALVLVSFFARVVHGRGICAFLVASTATAVAAIALAHRLATIRATARERFQLPGSDKEDRRVALLHTSRTIRQLGRHLQCDRVVFTRAPNTLPSYQV